MAIIADFAVPHPPIIASQVGKGEEEAYARLARVSVGHSARIGCRLTTPPGLEANLSRRRAGAFVSIKKNGKLRGCVGTVALTRPSLAEEIVENAISVCARDPRFFPITEAELPLPSISVDALSPAESAPRGSLDPKRFVVIVSRTTGGDF